MIRLAQVAILLALTGCERAAVDRALQRMSDQPRYQDYRLPPAGTVAREAVLDSTAPPITSELLAVGRSRFRIFCAACHGDAGFGGSVVAANMTGHRPPSLRRPELARLPPEFYYGVITKGVGRMPSFAAELSSRERWAVIAYLQQIQRSPVRTAEEHADSVSGARLRELDSLARRHASPPGPR